MLFSRFDLHLPPQPSSLLSLSFVPIKVRQQVLTTGDPGLVGFVRTPLVDLPLGATEDRVCGTIDFERALMEGERCKYECAQGHASGLLGEGFMVHVNKDIMHAKWITWIRSPHTS